MARSEKRLWVVGASLAVGFAALVARAAQIQLIDGGTYAARAEAQRTGSISLPARRGALYDRNGVPIAATIEIYHVGLDRDELRDPATDVPIIARHLGLPEREIRRRLRKSYAHFEGPFSAAQVLPLRGRPGVYPTSDLVRSYPDPDFARAVIGRPAEGGRPSSGLERELDTLLAGVPGQAVVIKDGRGRQLESPGRLQQFPVPGHDVVLTIDATLQDIAESALAEAIDRLHADGGDVVMLDPRTGEVLALVSRSATGASTASGLTSAFEPGSTAKLFAAAALLEHDLVAGDDSVYGERGVWELPHRTIHDDHPEDLPRWMSLADAIRVSSNIGTAKFAQRLTPSQQYRMLRAFGLGTHTGVEYPAESPGRLYRPDAWSGTSAQSVAIGYEISVTPLQLAQAYAVIANDGILLRPTLIKQIRDARGRVVYDHRAEPVRRVVRPDVAQALREMLRGVVAEGGTGVSAAMRTYEVAGKTGTARRARQGGYDGAGLTAVFAALFPAEDVQLVTVVKLDAPQGGYAALTTAPLTRRMLEQALAARSEGLDRGPFAREARGPATGPYRRHAGDSPRNVVAWPIVVASDSVPSRRIPNVSGLPLRE
ncbi:MAG: penicillin-binding protein 2, partial [Gemmatimonadota bacterium]|nr:penicillin-binding protein 2 [Gemmatimonadota bacterium]